MFETVCSKQRIIDDSDTQESFYIKTIDKKPQFSLTNVISEVDSRKEYRKMLHDQFQQAEQFTKEKSKDYFSKDEIEDIIVTIQKQGNEFIEKLLTELSEVYSKMRTMKQQYEPTIAKLNIEVEYKDKTMQRCQQELYKCQIELQREKELSAKRENECRQSYEETMRLWEEEKEELNNEIFKLKEHKIYLIDKCSALEKYREIHAEQSTKIKELAFESKELEKLKIEFIGYEKLVEDYQQMVEKSEKNIESIKEENDLIIKKENEEREENHNLKKEIEAAEITIDELKKEIEAAKLEIVHTIEEKEQCERDNKTNLSRILQLQDNSTKFIQTISEYTAYLQTKESEIYNLQKTIEDQKHIISNMTAAHKQEESKHNSEINSFKGQLEQIAKKYHERLTATDRLNRIKRQYLTYGLIKMKEKLEKETSLSCVLFKQDIEYLLHQLKSLKSENKQSINDFTADV